MGEFDDQISIHTTTPIAQEVHTFNLYNNPHHILKSISMSPLEWIQLITQG